MKKAVILLLLLALVFTGCTPQVTPEPTQAPATEAALTEAPAPSEAPEVMAPYAGARKKYTYIWENERDRKWEEDIVAFADLFLDPYRGHPLLSDRVISSEAYNDLVLRYSSASLVSFFEPELKDEFMARVNELILAIPELTDLEICFALKETVALLNDEHSTITFSDAKYFPLELFSMMRGDTCEAVIVSAPESEKDIIGCIVTAINGVPLEEIAQRIHPLLPCENEAGYIALTYDYYMTACPYLRYAGALGEEDEAEFSLIDPEGNELSRRLTARAHEELWEDSVDFETEREDDPVFLRFSNNDDIAWYKMLMDGEVLYFRVTTCMVDESFGDVVAAAFAEAAETGKLKKVIVDFRDNGGGYIDLDGNFLPLANAMRDSGAELYVLIDGFSFSAAVAIPAMLKRRVEGVTLVGADARQPVRFFFNPITEELPNFGICCWCANIYGDFWPDYGDEPLAPDIVVRQTYDDFLNGIDSVLHYILFAE